MTTLLLTITGWLIFAAWLYFISQMVYAVNKHSLLNSTKDLPDPEEWPGISIVITGKNEEDNVAATVDSLLRLKYPNLELTMINDRSTDRTGEILHEIASKNPKVVVEDIKELPPNWIGKSHALYQGSKRATKDYLLFSDSDVVFDEEVLNKAMKFSLAKDLDHLVMVPYFQATSLLHDAVINSLALTFITASKPKKIETTDKKAYMGIGQFNLIKRSTYERTGGHKAIRFDLIDDMKLGKLIKANDGKESFLFADAQIKFRWYNKLWDIVKGMEKNFFASVDYKLSKVILSTLVYVILYFIPVAMAILLYPDPSAYGYMASVIVFHIASAYYAKKIGYSIPSGLLITFGVLISLIALWNSTIVTLKQKGVNWRDTFYPLDELRKKMY